jgi:hypothetical protein
MHAAFYLSYVLLWLVMAVVLLLVILMYRHFGLMMMSGGRRVNLGGLDVGSKAPAIPIEMPLAPDVKSLAWGENSLAAPDSHWFILFSLPGCPMCQMMAESPEMAQLPTAWDGRVSFLWLAATPGGNTPDLLNWLVGTSGRDQAFNSFDVPASPFAFVLRGDGTVLGKSLVNSAQEAHGLIERSLKEVNKVGIRLVDRTNSSRMTHM